MVSISGAYADTIHFKDEDHLAISEQELQATSLKVLKGERNLKARESVQSPNRHSAHDRIGLRAHALCKSLGYKNALVDNVEIHNLIAELKPCRASIDSCFSYVECKPDRLPPLDFKANDGKTFPPANQMAVAGQAADAKAPPAKPVRADIEKIAFENGFKNLRQVTSCSSLLAILKDGAIKPSFETKASPYGLRSKKVYLELNNKQLKMRTLKGNRKDTCALYLSLKLLNQRNDFHISPDWEVGKIRKESAKAHGSQADLERTIRQSATKKNNEVVFQSEISIQDNLESVLISKQCEQELTKGDATASAAASSSAGAAVDSKNGFDKYQELLKLLADKKIQHVFYEEPTGGIPYEWFEPSLLAPELKREITDNLASEPTHGPLHQH